MEKRKNNLLQESLYLQSLPETATPEPLLTQLSEVAFEVEYKTEDVIFKKYATVHLLFSFLSLLVVSQFGFSWWPAINLGNFLLFLGPLLYSGLTGVFYGAGSLVAASYWKLSSTDLAWLQVNKIRYIYGVMVFSGILLASFGPLFSWGNLFTWFLGMILGVEQGFKFSRHLVEAKEAEKDE